MQVQNLEPTAGTLGNFRDFCERLESALDDHPADNKSNKTYGQERGNKKRYWNNSNNKGKRYYCIFHGHNPMHSTEQYRTLKKEAEKHKQGCKNGNRKLKAQLKS